MCLMNQDCNRLTNCDCQLLELSSKTVSNSSRQCTEHTHHHCRHLQRRANFNFSYWFQAALLGVLSVTSTLSAPVNHQRSVMSSGSGSSDLAAAGHSKVSSTTTKPRWVNPCGLQGHVFDAQTDTMGVPDSITLIDLFGNIVNSAAEAKRQALKVKQEFLNNTFSDNGFEEGIKGYKQDWLPNVPKATEGHFRTIEREVAFKSSFEMLQYFAVGIQQIILDETMHFGKFVQIFKDVEYFLIRILCDLQMGMYVLKIKPNEDILKDVMSYEYRDTSDSTMRHIRDYLILRDYIKAVDYVAELFAYLQSKVNQ